jgi:formylglycine-generating enzyme required for sulfatase activity
MPIRYLFLSCLFLSACTQNTQDEPATDSQLPVEIQDCTVCPVMVELPAGSFLMGTAEADRLIDPRTGKPAKNDMPQHPVTIGTPFAIGKFEVTAKQFGDFVSASGYQPEAPCMEFSPPESFTISADFNWNDTGFPQTNDAPVGCVSFFDAQAYAAWLSTISGNTYRLPTEAEWEYAARAGSTTPFYWGTDTAVVCDYANVRSAGAFTISKRQAEADVSPGFPCDDGFAHSAPVGSFLPNAFGLYDMQGNAWEWVTDCNHKNYAGAPTDGSAWLDDRGCQFGVIRSGSYLNLVERSSTTVRAGRPREGRATNMGFRVVRVTAEAPQQVDTASAAWGTTAAPTDDAGAILFNNNCAACHVRRDDYRGVYGIDQAVVEATIRDGGNNIMSMPAFGEILTAAEISTLAAYVRSQNGWD